MIRLREFPGSVINRFARAFKASRFKKAGWGIAIVSAFVKAVMITSVAAAPLPNGDSQTESIDEYKIKIGLQHRVMWNRSNIPLSGVTSAADSKGYDFFRQRLRLNLEIQPVEKAGAFIQLEYRGGWGGSSPASSDPREAGVSLNAFNRLQARGVRYGYIYYTPSDKSSLAAGIIPVSDRLGDVLFSADWDFNVGGITWNSTAAGHDYRLAYVRLVDGVGSSDKTAIDQNGDLIVADVTKSISDMAQLGLHVYYLNLPGKTAIEAGFSGKVTQGWYAVSGSADFERAKLNGFVCVNKGSFGDNDNTGFALKAEGAIPVGTPTLNIMGVYSSGDDEGEAPDSQFRTVQGMFGTEGFWAYCHIFTSNPPSDVNDFGVGLDNNGRGLLSLQAKGETPITEKLSGEVSAGWFQASAENADGNSDMGAEIGGVLTCEMAEHLNLQVGTAYDILGDYYKIDDDEPDNIHEVFCRFQLHF